MRDPYSVLGLTPGASEDEIKKAYKRLAKQYHPDVTGNSPEAERKMQEINAAYDELMNKRGGYNPFESQSAYNRTNDEEPLIFRKEIYALACVFGGVVFWICREAGMSGAALQIVTAVAVIAARVVSVHFGLKLPTLK